MKKILPFIIVIGVLYGLISIMKSMKPKIEVKEEEVKTPTVMTLAVQPQDFTIPIKTDGVLKPKAQVNLTAEVAGKVLRISNAFANNGSFKKGDVLIEIDPKDYELAITRAKANVSSQVANLELQQAKSDLAKEDWQKYGKQGQPSALNLNLPQVNSAKAALAGARADLKLAERNLEKTKIIAPYDGVVLNRMINVGQFVVLGSQLGTVASSEKGELRVALSDDQLSMIQTDSLLPEVSISSLESGSAQWSGKVVTIESQRDEKTLLNYAIIDVENPLTQQQVPLRFNSFVNVQFSGNTLSQIVPVSRSYMLLGNKVRVLDKNSQLAYRPVQVAFSDEENYYITSGLKLTDEIITTQLANLKEGTTLNKDSGQ